MASPRLMRRKISMPSMPLFIGQSKARKQGIYGNKLDVVDHLNTKSNMTFLRRLSINPSVTMYPIAVVLPSGMTQVVAIPNTAKLKDVLEEVKDELPLGILAYGLHDSKGQRRISLSESSNSFIGCELKIVKLGNKCDGEQNQEGTTRLQLLRDLCTSEQFYNSKLKATKQVYKLPLQNLGLDDAELCLLFDGNAKAKLISDNFLVKLENLINNWDPENTCTEELFDEPFWDTYENYITDYELSKRTLKNKRETDPVFTSFVSMQKSFSGKSALEALILSPLQRVPQYEHFLGDLLTATPTTHKDFGNVEQTVEKLHRLSQRRSGYLHHEESEFKIIQVQERFPHDKLDLDVTLEEHEKLKYKRHHSPSMRHKKGTLPADIEIEHRKLFDENDKCGRASPTSSALTRRIYIQEGAVKLSSANSTNERYFFLFNDLLLIAKPKSASTFKLKERVKVSEIWLAQCIDEVTDVTIVHEKAFVIGWPTTNYVAAFNSTEEKDLWLNALQKSINERREHEEPKEVPIKVCNRINVDDSYSPNTVTFSVTSKHDAREVIKMSLEQFQYQNEEPNDYQLWLSTKDMGLCPLIGHESPYSIKMNHYRTSPDMTHDENENQFDGAALPHDAKCQFVLKKTKKDLGNSQKKWKNPIKKSPIINWAMNKKTVKVPYNQMEVLPPGKLFGNPLIQLSTEEEMIPKPIQDILLQLFQRGPTTTGIFRKSANQRTVKQIRLALDQGKEVNFEEKSAIVLATVIKDFCRSLPDSLIVCDLYDDLVSSKSTEELSARIEQVKRILSQLPKEHYEVTMKFMCALYHIQRFSERNNMNSYNLSICVSPSVMWPPVQTKLSVTEQAAGSSDVVCFLIDNYVAIFSEENEYLLGGEADIQLDDGPGEDSDSSTDQFIYKCRQPSDDNDGDVIRNDFEKENEPRTPDFVFTTDENSMNSAFTHSDSSLGTNDSDETKSAVILNVPSISLAPEKISGSKSSPSSPTASRKREILLIDKSKIIDSKAHSDISDHEGLDTNEQFQRKLLRQHRNKRVLSSTTTSAELIEHKRHLSESPPSPNEKRKQFTELSNKTMENMERSNSPTNTIAPQKVAKKSVISQPLIQHFATEYYATPNVIFHSVDRRRQPAAPSYEEHIQRTQSKHRIVQSTTVKQPVIAQATLIQKQQVDEYEPLKNFVNALETQDVQRVRKVMPVKKLRLGVAITSELDAATAPNTIKVKKVEKTVHTIPRAKSSYEIQRANIDSTFNSIFETINKNMPVTKERKTTPGTDSASSMSSMSSNVTNSSLEISPPRTAVANSDKNIDTSPAEPDRSKFPKLELNFKSDYTSAVNSLPRSQTFSTIESDINYNGGSMYSSSTESHQPNHQPKVSPQSVNNPFSLNFEKDSKKNSLKSEAQIKSHSINFQKTSLTKAPMKLDQLRVNNLPIVEPGRVITARELRKTNRRLKSEIRNAFNDGFGYKHGKDISSESEQIRRNKKVALNGHMHRSEAALREIKSRQAMKFIERQNEEAHNSKQTADLLEISKYRYTENNNILTDDKDILKKNWSHNESYV